MDAGDYVRLEIETALARPDVVVVPVLVEDAPMPTAAQLPRDLHELTRLNACRLGDSNWDYDLQRLGDALAPILGTAQDAGAPEPDPSRPSPPAGPPRGRGTLLAAGPVAHGARARAARPSGGGGAGSISDLEEARQRIVFYALERGITWAVVGAAVLAAWVVIARAERPLVGSALAGACAGFIGGFIGGVLFQGSKYLNNPSLSTTLEVPSGVTARCAGYAVAAGLIGWALAGATRRLSRGSRARPPGPRPARSPPSSRRPRRASCRWLGLGSRR